MIINNANFNDFLQNRVKREYTERVKDENYYFFKLPYDEDCDFIHVVRIYCSRYNTNGKPGLKDESKLGGIYIYSLGLLFNLEYELRSFLKTECNESADIQEYYKRLCRDISAEVIRRVESGLFDRADAKQLIPADDGVMQYINDYRERESVERTFLEGLLLTKPDICITYDTRCEYDIEAVLKYLRCPADIINERATAFMIENKAMIYRQIIRAEIQFEELKKLEADTSHPLHYKREIQRILRTACVKTVNVTFERNGQSVTVKTEANRLGWSDTVSDYSILAGSRYTYNKLFGYKVGGDARLTEITLITHGKKELYNKSNFDNSLKEAA